MTIGDYLGELLHVLVDKFGKREAKSMLQILREDSSLFKNREDEVELSGEESILADKIKNQLIENVPIQQITQKAFFYGYSFYVDSNVLIPRPETEELVREVLEFNEKEDPKILDIGTGSGCIALSLKKNLPLSAVTAIDASLNALVVARRNAELLKVRTELKEVNFLSKQARNGLGVYDIIVSNPPYISYDEKEKMDKGVVSNEPHMALFVESDPLLFYKCIVQFAKEHLASDGFIAVEINEYRSKETLDLFVGYRTSLIKDMQGKARIILAQKMN